MFITLSIAMLAIVQISVIVAFSIYNQRMMRLLANVLKTEDLIHQVVEDHDHRIKKLESLI